MELDIRALNFAMTPGLNSHVAKSLTAALDRFEPRVELVHVRLEEEAPHSGPNETRCQMHINIRHASPVIVEQHDADLYSAVDRAAQRAKRTVRRQICRRRDTQRAKHQAKLS